MELHCKKTCNLCHLKDIKLVDYSSQLNSLRGSWKELNSRLEQIEKEKDDLLRRINSIQVGQKVETLELCTKQGLQNAKSGWQRMNAKSAAQSLTQCSQQYKIHRCFKRGYTRRIRKAVGNVKACMDEADNASTNEIPDYLVIEPAQPPPTLPPAPTMPPQQAIPQPPPPPPTEEPENPDYSYEYGGSAPTDDGVPPLTMPPQPVTTPSDDYSSYYDSQTTIPPPQPAPVPITPDSPQPPPLPPTEEPGNPDYSYDYGGSAPADYGVPAPPFRNSK